MPNLGLQRSMIERYSDEAITDIFSKANTMRCWLKTELEVMAIHFSSTAMEDAASILCAIEPQQIVEETRAVEATCQHDVSAFVRVMASKLEQAGRADLSAKFHHGITSSDIVDTTLAMQIEEAGGHIGELVCKLLGELSHLATIQDPCAARTHGRRARRIPFGRRFAVYTHQIDMQMTYINLAQDNWTLMKLAGPTGTEIPAAREVQLRDRLQLPGHSTPLHTQCVSRVHHFNLLSAYFGLALVLDKIALDMRLLAIEEVGEVNEGYGEGRDGSSSMPTKKNPVSFEKINGLCRLMRGYLLTASENSSLWLERDISHSSAERVIIPDFFHALSHMISTAVSALSGLVINQEQINNNAAKVIDSYQQLTNAVTAGSTRSAAYETTKTNG